MRDRGSYQQEAAHPVKTPTPPFRSVCGLAPVSILDERLLQPPISAPATSSHPACSKHQHKAKAARQERWQPRRRRIRYMETTVVLKHQGKTCLCVSAVF